MPGCPSAAAGLAALALTLTGALAQAEAPPAAAGRAVAARDQSAAPAGVTAAPTAQVAQVTVRGAVVVAADDESAPAAHALARAVYREAALRPTLDEAAARTLVGDPPAAGAPAALQELAEVRGSIAHAGSEPIARRLLASLGAGAGAALVVVVATTSGTPTARVLRIAGATYAPIELGAIVQRSADGAAATFEWPGAAAALRALLAPDPNRAPGGRDAARPLAPTATAIPKAHGKAPAGTPSMWSSPWFWGSLAGVAAIGVTVLVFAETSSGDSDSLRLQGRIAP